ncbi:extracellular solute-binding protein [Paenibacillus sp. LHD-117]|uniref:extracellular solute-binding protein n=1 Tax=Paenibacillus sp. LHD-117 TaxID=3071412 RepID=UPI0027DF6DF4|nr:extracellular solute-binding protein [Paenibacillus sp. LHD-117]MDQ6422303.1 extracellular solute-binding protein [Paenibacillus sp. LHD-117]
MSKKWAKYFAIPLMAMMLIVAGCSKGGNDVKPSESGNDGTPSVAPEGKPETWIADRKIKGLVFMGTDDYTEEMNPEILAKIKERTGIDFEIEIMKAERSIDGLVAGIAANDLPDFIAFYLNNSGRPEMQVVMKAAREGMFTDLTPLIKDTKVYSKYLQDGYLPIDTQYGVMFRPEFNGSTYFVHMNVNRQGGYDSRKYVGGPYIRKDIAEALGVDPSSIKTTEQLYELAKQIKAGGFKDKNGKDVVPIGPAYWGGKEVGRLFADLQWGEAEQWIKPDESGKMLHEVQTPVALQKVGYVQKLLNEKLLQPEFFTIDETQATEGALNGTWGIIADMHNYQEFNQDMHYLPIGPLNTLDGEYKMQVDFKSGYSAWAIPATTKKPEEVVRFADYLASREGKLLWMYGLEGRDYTLGADGNPLVKQEVIDLKESDPNAAKKLGFGGVRNWWGELLGSTDIDRMADYGEMEYGEKLKEATSQGALNIAEYWKWDEKRKNADVVDAYAPLSFLSEFDRGADLKAAFDNYRDSLVRAYYSKNTDEAKEILDSALKQMQAAGLDDYLKLVEEKNADPITKVKFRSSY